MALRKVPLEAVEWALGHYDDRRDAKPLPKTKPAEIYFGEYNGRRLKVYVEIGTDPLKVKTTTWED